MSAPSEEKFIIKRNGQSQLFNKEKITKRITRLVSDLPQVNCSILLEKTLGLVINNMTTHELDVLVAEEAHSRCRYSLQYNKLASRIRWSDLHKSTENTFGAKLELLKDKLETKYYEFAKECINIIEKHINYDLDYNIDYFGFMTLNDSYLLKSNGKTVERYQDLLMRVAIALNIGDMKNVLRSYKAFSKNKYTHATTTLFNAGLVDATLSSCFLLTSGDSIKNICCKWGETGMISAKCGGMSVNMTPMREQNREIKSTSGRTDGHIKFVQVFEKIAEAINQGGKRNGSITVVLEIWHPEVPKFLELRTNTGNDEAKAKGIFTQLVIPDIFFKKLIKAVEEYPKVVLWSYFSPLDHPELMDLYGEELERRYLELENNKRYVNRENILDLFKKICKSEIETGNPNIMSKCNINRISNQINIGVIKSSNLCTEIVQYQDENESAVCSLCSIALPKFVKDGKFRFGKLRRIIRLIIHNMNRVLDIDNIPIKNNSKKQRSIGVGVQGLTDVYKILKLSLKSFKARKLNREIFENIYYWCIFYSNKLAMRYGPYPEFEGSPLSKGIFQFDHFQQYNEETGKHEIVKVPLTLDWETLRASVVKYGTRNSLFVAPMPTASTAQILGNTESIELCTSNIYTRKVQSGTFTVIDKYLYAELEELGLWSIDLANSIIGDDGSVQSIDCIPDDIKERYLTCWEIEQRVLVEHAADRTPFVDQSMSLSAFYKKPTESKLLSYYVEGWKQGLKTLSYYIRTRSANDAVKVTVENKREKKFICTDEVCVSCQS